MTLGSFNQLFTYLEFSSSELSDKARQLDGKDVKVTGTLSYWNPPRDFGDWVGSSSIFVTDITEYYPRTEMDTWPATVLPTKISFEVRGSSRESCQDARYNAYREARELQRRFAQQCAEEHSTPVQVEVRSVEDPHYPLSCDSAQAPYVFSPVQIFTCVEAQ